MANYGGAASGALSGAAAGSVFGPIGSGIGGLIGGITGLFGGNKKKKKKLSSFDKNQQRLNDQQYQGILGKGPLSDLYNYDSESANAVFDQIQARPAQRNFAENTVPTLTGAFRNQGLQNSSYLGDSLSKAGRDVQENLDALRSQYLYNEQKDARGAKRNAVENLQNRNTFAYDAGQKPFDIASVIDSISPEQVDKLKGYFSKAKGLFSKGAA